MLQKSLLFLHTAEEDKHYIEELEMNLVRTSPVFNFATTVAISLFFCILGLIGNGIIFCLLCYAIKKTRFTIYVANLAAGDFLTVLHAFISFVEFFIPHLINTRSRQLMVILFFFGHEAHTYFLAAMSIERCLTVFFPIWYKSHRQKCSTALVCTFLWTLSVTMKVLNHFLCTKKYISALNIGTSPCKDETMLNHIIILIILPSSMVLTNLALCIRMKTKPREDLPARLDISIWITVGLHLILSSAMEIVSHVFFSFSFSNFVNFYYLTVILYCVRSSVNPFVYLAVGCWKWEKGQEPFYMFLERALKYDRKRRVRIQADPVERKE